MKRFWMMMVAAVAFGALAVACGSDENKETTPPADSTMMTSGNEAPAAEGTAPAEPAAEGTAPAPAQ